MVDAHGVELPDIRNHLDDALGIFLQLITVDSVCEQAFEYVHPFTEPILRPERAAEDHSDLQPQIDPLDAHEQEVHQLWKFFRDDLIQIGAVGDCEDAELARSEVSVGWHWCCWEDRLRSMKDDVNHFYGGSKLKCRSSLFQNSKWD